MTIGGQTTINVSLIVSTKKEEVVVVGYGTQKRADVTGSVATVKSQDIANKPPFSATGTPNRDCKMNCVRS